MAKWLKRIGLALLVLILLTLFAVWWLLRGSLPQLDGELALPGLSAPVTIQRDKLGVVTIDAANETDAMRALGYVHAQERYFEMDLMRRTAAGELAELFGPIALDTDKRHRIHRMRARATENLALIAGDRIVQLRAYTDGVNAGLADLKTKPWPYLLIGRDPQPWLMADSALTGYAMYFDLQDSENATELALWKIRQKVPDALYALLTHDGSSWDAPLTGEPRGDALLPTADQLDLRKLPAPDRSRDPRLTAKPENGSNNFAVAGALTQDGRAIVADDMHLGLRAPDLWFRARMRYPDPRAPGSRVDIAGFTLPGLPAVVVGSNGHVAWAFTNSYGDWLDWVKGCDSARGKYELCNHASNAEKAHTFRERIRIKGGKDYVLDVVEDGYGVRLATDLDSHPLRLWWVAHEPNSLNFRIADLASARNIEDALAVADDAGMPAQNFVVADVSGRIAWTIVGPLRPLAPAGCDGKLATWRLGYSVAHYLRPDGTTSSALISPSAFFAQELPGLSPCQGRAVLGDSTGAFRPRIVDPASHRLWTANARTLDGRDLQQMGDGGYALGARAGQIRDDLLAKRKFAEKDLLAIQLDDRALFLQRWWQLLRNEAQAAKSPALQSLGLAAREWQGRASADSVSYRIVRAWRLAVHARILDGLTAPAQAALGENFEMPGLSQMEGIAWPLVSQRPMHLLSRRYPTWDALFEDAAKEVRDELAKDGPLSERTWGERNTAAICHPLAKAIPLIGKRLLCMPPDQLDGDTAMPRVAGPAFGASERMVVSPGHEADGIVHMPGGQSGHFLSPFWGAGHDDWVQGRPTPFLPGEAEYTLRMVPAH